MGKYERPGNAPIKIAKISAEISKVSKTVKSNK
jgi:hypothetical protein